jgi:AraC-like DNA-binding protein
MSELTVGAGLARGLLRFAVGRGAGEAALLARSGIAADDLTDQDNRIPFGKYVTLMRAAKELCNDPALALHYGAIDDLAEISVVGLIGQASESFIEALAQLNRYGKLVIEVDAGGDRFTIAHEGGELLLRDNRANPNDFFELTESTFARMANGAKNFPEVNLLKKVYVTHAAPPYRADYEALFRVPVVFSSDKNALVLDQAWLTHKLQLQPRYVFGILSEHAEKLLKDLETSKTVRGRVESLLMPILHTGDISMDKIAETMAMSRQTLFRKLKAEGVTFEKVLDDLRQNLALHYLGGKKVSVNQTAYLVGFSEAAAFSRAFKRWTGKSPRDVRGR